MFTCFNIDLSEHSQHYIDCYYSEGLKVFKNNKNTVHDLRNVLNEYVDPNGYIDGNKLQNNWFKPVETDIFISHSHKDEQLAIAIAGWLKCEFGLSSFIDSCLWGYSNDLLKKINDDYNKIEENLYDHNKANYAASHVHMMLATALNKMLNKSECIFFLSTENSLIKTACSPQTNSPWIYLEISLANTIKKHYPRLFIKKGMNFDKREFLNETNQLNIKYDINLKSFISLKRADLLQWKWKKDHFTGHALDALYEQCQILIPKK